MTLGGAAFRVGTSASSLLFFFFLHCARACSLSKLAFVAVSLLSVLLFVVQSHLRADSAEYALSPSLSLSLLSLLSLYLSLSLSPFTNIVSWLVLDELQVIVNKTGVSHQVLCLAYCAILGVNLVLGLLFLPGSYVHHSPAHGGIDALLCLVLYYDAHAPPLPRCAVSGPEKDLTP